MPLIAQTPVPCVLMRGGTSKGTYFLASDLPADPATRDRVLLAVMGSPDPRQIDGVGGANPLTSKVAIVSRSTRPDASAVERARPAKTRWGCRTITCRIAPTIEEPPATASRSRAIVARSLPA